MPRDCRVFVAISPANQWGWTEVLQNRITYLLEMLLWQNSYDPKKKAEHRARKPKPFVPDFMKQPNKTEGINREIETHTTDEIRAILAMPRG